MNTPLISIIIPAYNQAPYLDECLQSVHRQTFTNWECIVVDDGSMDDTESIVQNWVKKDRKFKYYKKQNGGVSAARNLGIKEAKGKWILLLDGDDKIESKYLDFASKHFDKNVDIIYCNAQYFGLRNDEFILEDFETPKMLLENQIFCSAFFKKDDWEKVGGFDESMQQGYEDWDFWLSIISFKEEKINILKLDYLGFFYRIKEVSRNTEAMKNSDEVIRNYLYQKYQHLYLKNITAFKNILHENQKLKKENSHLKNILNGKRYALANKIFKFFRL
ncbi:glycosyltransferase involved in cell wall biosynthesis [Chryseobacterium sp. SORGH_AS 447]|uniref:glycosyltransferase family 2 protein n=1 Tax=Chryseobacterium sp. SORGH_AS_0447 TaxID=3041769 RepID=UPI0027896F4A|nr:glycosyltransferase family A protein [Chryseobacterium sp. SORGH_AS_0447]MDQ1159699.1 glycosyltransferase involved in cell wall biosynthesis [Chryseobacterium sp. SORGH_AS_0447]